MRPLALLLVSLLLASAVPLAAHAKPPRVNGVVWIGGLELRFDANRWDVNGAKTAYDLFCKTVDCANTTIAVTITEGETCTPETLVFDDVDQPSEVRVDKFSRAGLDFLVSEGDFGCRNRAGGPVRACTTHDGRTYVFYAPGQACRTSPHIGESVDEILQGLRPR